MGADLVAIGKVLGAYRRGGEVKVLPLTDFPERFSDLEKVFLVGEEETRCLTVERAEVKAGTIVLRFAEVETRSEAQQLVGSTVEIPEKQVVSLPEGTYYVFQLIGMRVLTEGGDFLGEVADVLSMPANDVYVVKRDDEEVLIPAVEPVIRSIDLKRGEMVISPIPGLLD